jgi:hypothetical protein
MPTGTPTGDEIRRELDKIVDSKAELQRKLIREDRRLDVLARVLGYDVLPFHWVLIQAKRVLPGPWRLYLAPRGSGKSTILTVVDSVLLPLVEPNIRILIGSRVKDQSKDILAEIQGCFLVDRFCELFGDLRGDKWGTGEATVKTRTRQFKEPTWLAAGADGPVTSKHFDVVKADDLVDEKNSRTDGERERMHTFLYKTLVPTLMMVRADGTPGELDLVGTRYHPEDVYGRAIEEDGKFDGNVCEVPALVNPETGEPDPANGVSVVEEILPTVELKSLRISMGSAHFDSQYQQSTKRMKGNIFKDEFFLQYDEEPEDLVRRLELKIWGSRRRSSRTSTRTRSSGSTTGRPGKLGSGSTSWTASTGRYPTTRRSPGRSTSSTAGTPSGSASRRPPSRRRACTPCTGSWVRRSGTDASRL